MNFINSLLFNVFISIWGVMIPIIYSSVFITNNSKTADRGAKVWSQFIIWVLKKCFNITYQVKGLENLPTQGGYIVACKHQSMWETFVMHLIFNRPVYAYKKELLAVPFYGWYLRKMSGVIVDRQAGAKALKSLLIQSKKYLDNKQVVVIFPQGTRTPVNSLSDSYPYQSGLAALYAAMNVKIVPAALNSGLYWNKKGLTGKSGSIILEFLPPIEPGLDKREFLTIIENQIESKSKELANL
jgi:1-acyl-sn-glycerol-3-phosphate acyltransferase